MWRGGEREDRMGGHQGFGKGEAVGRKHRGRHGGSLAGGKPSNANKQHVIDFDSLQTFLCVAPTFPQNFPDVQNHLGHDLKKYSSVPPPSLPSVNIPVQWI